MSFIDSLLESTKEYEAPRRFYYWSALSAISAVLKDHVWFDMGGNYNLYPNIYVLLYGPSGVRKGPAISLAERIVKGVDNTRTIDGRSSIEAVIKELGTFVTRERKEPIKDSCCFLVASELSASIISNSHAMDIMTNFYDRIYNTEEWKYRLKNSESVTLKRPTITWLSGTNEALFREFVPEKNIHGGLIGRIFMIMENRPARINSLMYRPSIVPDVPKLTELLKPMSALKGEFKTSDETRKEIDTFYNKFMLDIAPGLQDETGFVSRILDFVIKNAMLISCGRRGDMIIAQSDYEEAVEITLPLILPTKKTSLKTKKVDSSGPEKRGLILSYLSNQPGFCAPRLKILRDLGLKIDHEDLNKVIDLMLQMEVVECQQHGSETHYKLKMENEKVRKWIEQFRS